MLSKKLLFYLKTANVYAHYKLRKYIPFIIAISPTVRCNLKCAYCKIWQKKYTKCLKINKLFELIDEIHKFGVPYISFSGGEPLLIKDLEKVGAYAIKKNIFVNLGTNATLINKKRAEKIANSFSHIRVSLDGLEETHDTIAGVKGTYKKVVSAIDYLTSVPHRKAKIGINYVLNNNNISEVRDFIQIFQKKVDFISFLPKFHYEQTDKYEFFIPTKNLIKIHKQLENYKKSGNTRGFIRKANLEYSKTICDAGRLYLTVWNNGDVCACPYGSDKNDLGVRLGSIYKNKLPEILAAKNNVPPSNRCLGCYATCTTEVSRVFRMSPLQLIKNAYYLKKTFKF